jgi:hypothetical protein
MDILKKILRSKLFIAAVAVVACYTMAGFFLAPWLVRHYVPKIVQEQLNKQAVIGEVRFNPYIFTFEVNDFRMDEPDGQLIAGLRRLFVDFELKSLFKWAWTFRQVSLEGPQVNVVINHDGALNLAQLAPPSTASPPPPSGKEGGLPRLILEDIAIDQGQIDFTDNRQSIPATVSLTPFNLQMKNITTLPKGEGSDSITATTKDGETIRWAGRISLNPVVTKGTLAIENLRTATLWEFARDAMLLEQPAGTLTVAADYDIDLGGIEPQIKLGNLAFKIKDLALKLPGGEKAFLEMPDLQLSGGKIDLPHRQAEVGRLAITGGRARLSVDKDGIFTPERIFKASTAQAPADSPATGGTAKPWNVRLAAFDLSGFALDYQDASRTPGAKIGIGGIKVDLTAEAEAGSAETQVRVNGLAVGVSGFNAGFADAPDPAVRIGNISLEGGAYDLAANSLSIDRISLDGGGIDIRREADGAMNLALLAAPPQRGAIAKGHAAAAAEGRPFKFLAQAISVSGLKTVFSDRSVQAEGPIVNLEDFALVLKNVDGRSPMTFDMGVKIREGGQIKTTGTVNPALPSVQTEIQVTDLGLAPFQPYLDKSIALVLKSGAISTRGTLRYGIKDAEAQTTFQGGVKVDNLRLVEPHTTETFLGWKALQTDQMKLQLDPNRIEMGELTLAQLVGKFVIFKDRTLNVAKVIKTAPGAKPAAPTKAKAKAGPADPFPVLVRKITLSEGRVEFADLSMTPQFGTKIHELKGAVTGISTAQNTRAQVKLDGRVDEYGTAKIDGELNTSDPKSFTNISVVFRNVEMARLTPYSGHFAGRKIDSGKLSVDLKYQIQKGQLAGDNKIIVERLVLGEKIASPDAVDLPLDLAVALMEDSDGVIDIGLPVKGDLNSPEFSYGSLIWKALTNLITKIVTSPFRALGALLPGGGEETLNVVAFEPGRPDVPPPEQEKLAKLAMLLEKRPQLKLSVQGRYNPETDLMELRSASLRHSLAIRQGQKLQPGDDPGPVDYSNPESQKALEAMFVQRFGADSLKGLKADLKAAEDKAKADAVGKVTAAAVELQGSGQLGKVLFGRLVDAEPMGNPDLIQLADARSRAIAATLSGANANLTQRVEVKPSATVDKKDVPSAALSLEAAR